MRCKKIFSSCRDERKKPNDVFSGRASVNLNYGRPVGRAPLEWMLGSSLPEPSKVIVFLSFCFAMQRSYTGTSHQAQIHLSLPQVILPFLMF